MNETYIERTVYYHDTDAVGIMYYGACLKMFEEGRTDYFNKNNVNVAALHNANRYFAIKDLSVEYVSPGRFGEVLVCESFIQKQTAVRIVFKQKLINKASNQVVANAQIVLVVLNKHLKPVRVATVCRQCTEG